MKLRIILVVALVISATVMYADVINIASTGTAPGVQTYNNLTTSATGNTIAILPNPAWYGPFAGSSWVSYVSSGVHDDTYVQVPNDTTVEFHDSFTLTGDLSWWSGSLQVLADDSTAVYLNDTLLFSESPASSGYPTCAKPEPIGCVAGTIGFVDLTPALQLGTNTLKFVTVQHAGDSFGLDYAGQVQTPEPASMILFGTGLTGLAGLLRRKLRG